MLAAAASRPVMTSPAPIVKRTSSGKSTFAPPLRRPSHRRTTARCPADGRSPVPICNTLVLLKVRISSSTVSAALEALLPAGPAWRDAQPCARGQAQRPTAVRRSGEHRRLEARQAGLAAAEGELQDLRQLWREAAILQLWVQQPHHDELALPGLLLHGGRSAGRHRDGRRRAMRDQRVGAEGGRV
mmetsp:Transcript_143033/g.398543  ORF Transcript_143033/g.398543 Transcript_143033/m.398543 type:complete len:186 (-) Transcript_143033:29-586(-)